MRCNMLRGKINNLKMMDEVSKVSIIHTYFLLTYFNAFDWLDLLVTCSLCTVNACSLPFKSFGSVCLSVIQLGLKLIKSDTKDL